MSLRDPFRVLRDVCQFRHQQSKISEVKTFFLSMAFGGGSLSWSVSNVWSWQWQSGDDCKWSRRSTWEDCPIMSEGCVSRKATQEAENNGSRFILFWLFGEVCSDRCAESPKWESNVGLQCMKFWGTQAIPRTSRDSLDYSPPRTYRTTLVNCGCKWTISNTHTAVMRWVGAEREATPFDSVHCFLKRNGGYRTMSMEWHQLRYLTCFCPLFM